MSDQLALFGGDRVVTNDSGDLFTWPIVTKEDEEAVLAVVRRGAMSDTDVTVAFEEDFKRWQGSRYALAHNTGTSAIHGALFGCGVGRGDEVVCISPVYWAAALPAYSLGATPVFADIEPDSLCLDPKDIERCVSERTRAILVVHYLGRPADMDGIMAAANKHGLKVIEDVSHAQGGLYRGRRLGTIGHVGAMSLMSGKSLVAGEAGIIVTNDKAIYETAIAAGHYERYGDDITTPEIQVNKYLPLLGIKGRVNQMSSALGISQLKHYDERTAEIRRAMNYFWDRLDGVPGIRAHRVDETTGSNMGGWYAARGLYVSEELGGLSVSRFCEAVRAEGVSHCSPGCNNPLHTHRLFTDADIYGQGKPTRIANAARDVRELDKDLPNTAAAGFRTYEIPWFKHYRPEIIDEYAEAFRKVALGYRDLLEGDKGNTGNIGYDRWHLYGHGR